MNLKSIDVQIAALARKLKTLHKLRKDCQDPEYCEALSNVISTPLPRTRNRRRPPGEPMQSLLGVLLAAKRPMLVAQLAIKLGCTVPAVRTSLVGLDSRLEIGKKGRFKTYLLKPEVAETATPKS